MSSENYTIQSGETPGGQALVVKTLVRLLIFIAILGAIWYAVSGTWDWVWAWLYLGLYGIAAIVAVLAVPLDEELIEERTKLKEDVKSWDKPIVIIGSIFMPLGMLIVAGLDVRFGWTKHMPFALSIVGLVLVMLGQLFSTWAAAVNRFYARFVRIQKERGHTVVTNGPYRIVRHPGYTGQVVHLLATALALGSWWAFVPSGVLAVMLIIRTGLEDKTLQEELPGYVEYAQQTRYRLLPGVW